jgi:hypothetical protein
MGTDRPPRYDPGMCRTIRPLFNFDPPATEAEMRDAALQFVRKIAGTRRPSKANAAAFDAAVSEVTGACARLLSSMVTTAPARDREVEAARVRERARKRFARPPGP